MTALNHDVEYNEGMMKVYSLLQGEDIDVSNLKPYVPKVVVYEENLDFEEFFKPLELERSKYRKRFFEIMLGFSRTLNQAKIVKLSKYLGIVYSSFEDRVFLPEQNEKDEYVGYYRYNRYPKPYYNKNKELVTPNKGLRRKNQRPNLTGAHLLKTWDINLPIILSEGHTDFVNLIGNGYRAVTVGSATSLLTPFLPILKGRIIHIWYDDDKPGIIGCENRMKEIIAFNKTVPIKDKIIAKPMFWSLEMEQLKETPETKGKVFTQVMRNRIMKSLQIEKSNIIWGKRKAKGYDFTDLFLEMDTFSTSLKNNLLSFLSQYKKPKNKAKESLF